MKPKKQPALGLLAGAASGFLASWCMLRFIQGPGTRIQQSLKSDDDVRHDVQAAAQRQRQHQPPPESVTMQAADTFASHAPGGRHLTRAERESGATVVHYGFGTLMGAAYGLAAEYTTLPTLGLGSVFGLGLWAATDLWSVPAVGYAKWPDQEPAAAHVAHVLAHLVYTVSLESTRRFLRRS